MTAGADEPTRVAVLAGALEAARRPPRVGPAREVAAIARVAETDRAVRRVEDIAALREFGPLIRKPYVISHVLAVVERSLDPRMEDGTQP